MAASSSGRDLSSQTKKAVQNLSKGFTDHEINIENASRPGLLTDMLNYDNSMDNDKFTALFTSQTVSTPYESHTNMLCNSMSQSSQIQDEHECIDTVDTIDIETLDTQLQNFQRK